MRGLGWPVTVRKKVVEDYMKDTNSSYHSLAKKYSIPSGTIQRWIELFGTPRSRTYWKKARRPKSKIDHARFLVSLGVPKTVAARKAGITAKLLYRVLREEKNPYENESPPEQQL